MLIENVVGSRHADVMIGNEGPNVADLGSGLDEFTGGRGADALIFGHGYGGAVFRDFNPDEDFLVLDTNLGARSVEELLRFVERDGAGLCIEFPHGDWIGLLSVTDPGCLRAHCLIFRVGAACAPTHGRRPPRP